ncbi:MAG: hypothetical protein QXF59_04530 [Candidatus Bathyarchaeia archaeon]|nr:hypothetical protein [Candidatus Bathyarchaeota archaeon]
MSDEDVDAKEILKRLEDLTRVLKIISDDLAEITKMLRIYVTSRTERLPANIGSIGQPQKPKTIDDIQKVFPQDLLGLLLFEVTDDYIIIKPRQYLGPENFARVASIVRDYLKGEYVSQGKDSHFRVLRRT